MSVCVFLYEGVSAYISRLTVVSCRAKKKQAYTTNE